MSTDWSIKQSVFAVANFHRTETMLLPNDEDAIDLGNSDPNAAAREQSKTEMPWPVN